MEVNGDFMASISKLGAMAGRLKTRDKDYGISS